MAKRANCPDKARNTYLGRAAKLNTLVTKLDNDLAEARESRRALMAEMNDAGMPWVEIGAAFNMSGPAAMYATGAAQRSPKTPQ